MNANTKECVFCFGTGGFLNTHSGKEEVCQSCDGTGVIPDTDQAIAEGFDKVFKQVSGMSHNEAMDLLNMFGTQEQE